MLLHEFLAQAAVRTPDAVAVIEPQRSIGYAALDTLANRFANVLRASGVRRGDRVLIALDNCIEQVAAYFGTMKAGAVAVPLPETARNDRLPFAIADATPAACIVDAAAAAECPQLATVPVVFIRHGKKRVRLPPGQTPVAGIDLAAAVADAADTAPEIATIDQDLAAIIYTSGSTGRPRGVMLRHRNLVANARSIVAYLGLTAADRVMCVLPLYYVYGLSLLHTHVAVGGSIVLDNRFVYPNVVLAAMRDHAVTGFAGVPSSFALLLHRSDLRETELPALRYVTQAGGSMPTSHIQDWQTNGPQVPFVVMYGATEASARLTYLPPSRLGDKLGSIGIAIPNTEIRVIKDDGTTAAPGEVGELVARGANIAAGYWNEPAESAARFTREGYRTGDLGYADEDGFLFLVGRRHDMIKVGAHRVGAREIEEVLNEYPAVHEVAVVSAPHPILGEVPVAFLSMCDDGHPGEDGVRAFCAARLAAHKVPARVFLLRELPKSGAGKLDKGQLREMALAQVGGEAAARA